MLIPSTRRPAIIHQISSHGALDASHGFGAYPPGGVGNGHYYNDPYIMSGQAPLSRHLDKANLLMMDGHVISGNMDKYWYDEFFYRF